MTRNNPLLAAWPLFAGLALIMAGNGLQGTLLGLRASYEDFGTFSIGIIMSLYYAGYLFGSVSAPRLVQSVGHIRVFTAMTALASITILLHGVFLNPVIWMAVRIITGFSFAALYIVVESWINKMATMQTRGRMLAIYLIVHYSALAAGQFLLYIAPPETIQPFILTSVLISLAALPIALSNRPGPKIEALEPFSLKDLFRVSPLGFVGVFLSGAAVGVLFSLTPVFGTKTGMSTEEIAAFMAVFIVGGIFGQFPLGMLSDKIGRRKTIIFVCSAAFLTGILCFLATGNGMAFYAFFFFFGFLGLSVYPLCNAYTFDHLKPEQYVSASGALILVNGAGAVSGPVLVSALVDIAGPDVFFPAISTFYLACILFGLYRSTRRETIPTAEQERYFTAPARPSTASAVMAAQLVEEGSEEV